MRHLLASFLALLIAFPLPALAQTGRAGVSQPALTEPVQPVAAAGVQPGAAAAATLAPTLALPNALPSALPSLQTPAATPSPQAAAPASALPSARPAQAAPQAAAAAPAAAALQTPPAGGAPVQAQPLAAPRPSVQSAGSVEASPSAEKDAAVDAQAGKKRIETRFEELRKAFAPRAVEDAVLQQGSGRLQRGVEGAATPAAKGSDPIAPARARFERQIEEMAAELGEAPTLKGTILPAGREALQRISQLIRKGLIAPARTRIRTSADAPAVRPEARTLRVGVYPVAADPFQWAHLLIGLRAIAELKLDKVVFVLAGDDPRKPNMTKTDFRHPMGRAVLEQFSPLFEYSSIAVGTTFDGETNIFRMLELNPEQNIEAVYIVGGDHYRFTDAKGNDDTLNKIAKKLADPKLIDRSRHSVSLAFVERDEPLQRLETPLDVHFLKEVGFEASSTQVRNGKYELMPWAAYEYVRKHRPGLYGIGTEPPR